jgi:hypothetical protein
METSLLHCCARSDCFIVMGDTDVFIVALLRNCNNFALSIVAATLTLLGKGDLTYATPPRKPNMSHYLFIYLLFLSVYLLYSLSLSIYSIYPPTYLAFHNCIYFYLVSYLFNYCTLIYSYNKHKTHIEAQGERMYSSYSFTTSALDGVSGQRHAPATLNLRGKTSGTHRTGAWVGLRDGLDTEVRGKISFYNKHA